MNWIFPIAGHGKRTSSLGDYKPLIEVLPGWSMLKLCLASLKSLIQPADRLVFIFSKAQEEEYMVEVSVRAVLNELNLYNNVDFATLEITPAGQALTIMHALDQLDVDILQDQTYVINSDQVVFFDPALIDQARNSVGMYFNQGAGSCFYNLDTTNRKVVEIKEKQKISCNAAAGVFYFTSAMELKNAIQWGIDTNKQHGGELYLGPCMEMFEDLSYFQTMMKFDLGNIEKITLFKKFCESIKEIR